MIKYILNVDTGTLHLKDGCVHSKSIFNKKEYRTEDEVNKDNTKYIKRCKLCFKGK